MVIFNSHFWFELKNQILLEFQQQGWRHFERVSKAKRNLEFVAG